MKRILIAAVAACTLALGGCSKADSEAADDATTPVITSIEEEPAGPEGQATATTVSEAEEAGSAAAPTEAAYEERAAEEFSVGNSAYVVEADGIRCLLTQTHAGTDYFQCLGEISEPVMALDKRVNAFYPANALLYSADRGFYEDHAGGYMDPAPTTLQPGQQTEINGYTFTSPETGEVVIERNDHSVTYSSGAYLPAGSTHPQVRADGTADVGALCGQVTMNPAAGPVDVVAASEGTNCHEGLAAFEEYAANLEVAGQNGVHMLYEAGPWTCSSGDPWKHRIRPSIAGLPAPTATRPSC